MLSSFVTSVSQKRERLSAGSAGNSHDPGDGSRELTRPGGVSRKLTRPGVAGFSHDPEMVAGNSHDPEVTPATDPEVTPATDPGGSFCVRLTDSFC